MILLSTTTDKKEIVSSIINREYRLKELVTVSSETPAGADMLVSNVITLMPDWNNLQPPVLFPPVTFNEDSLLGLIYAKLGNFEKAYQLLSSYPMLLNLAGLLNRLQYGIEIGKSHIEDGLKSQHYFFLHNRAIACHYGFVQPPCEFVTVQNDYAEAISNATDTDFKAFTEKHYALLLLDAGLLNDAETLLYKSLETTHPQNVEIDLKNTLCNVWMKQLVVPYNAGLLKKLKTTLWEVLTFYEGNNKDTEVALVLTDAAYIATVSHSFSEAMGYINRAISIFEEQKLEELLAQAHLNKANLLQTWAQNGNPQFYRTAVKAYQDALRTFTKENAPDIFAEIQHQLGKVYAEIPDEIKKKGVWAAVSVSSFNEALNYYNKVDSPYEFALICNSFGNAYTKYPLSLHTDNFDKALAWYREALDIRTAGKYPLERVLTLSNYLEASWFAGNKSAFDEERYNDMVEKAKEILQLSDDPAIRKSAAEHIRNLNDIKLQTATGSNN